MSHHSSTQKKVGEKSRECHNHNPSPSQTRRGRGNRQNQNKRKSNKRTKSTKINSLFPKRGNRNGKRTEKIQEQNNTKQDLKQIAL